MSDGLPSGALLTLERLPGSQFLETAKGLLAGTALRCTLNNSEPIPLNQSFIGLLYYGPLLLYTNHFRASYQTTRGSPYPLELTKII